MSDAKEAPAKKTRSGRRPVGSQVEFSSIPGRTTATGVAEPESSTGTSVPDAQTSGALGNGIPIEEVNQEAGLPEIQPSIDPAAQGNGTADDAGSADAGKTSGSNDEAGEPVYTIKRTYNLTTRELAAVASMQTAALNRTGKKPDTSMIVRLAIQLFHEQPDHLDVLLAHSRSSAKTKDDASS